MSEIDYSDPIFDKICREHPLTENVKMHYGDFITVVSAMLRRVATRENAKYKSEIAELKAELELEKADKQRVLDIGVKMQRELNDRVEAENRKLRTALEEIKAGYGRTGHRTTSELTTEHMIEIASEALAERPTEAKQAEGVAKTDTGEKEG